MRRIFENHQSDPVLIRQFKIICSIFILRHEAKELLELFCLMRQNRQSLLAFPKIVKLVSIRHKREKHCWN